jgi:hypothetical protein
MELNPEFTNMNAITSCTFQVPPDPSFGFRDQEEQEKEEEDDSSSEDEDIDHSEHFFSLAKKQVRAINC